MRIILLLLLLLTFLNATTLHGEILNSDDFQNLNNTIIKINGPTSTQFVAGGSYSIDLEDGNYTIIAYFYENGKLKYYSKDEVMVAGDEQRFDLVLLPSELQDIPSTDEEVPDIEVEKESEDNALFLIAGIAIVAIIAYFAFLKTRKKEHEVKKEETKAAEKEEEKDREDEEIKEEKYELDEDSKKILKILEEREGRMMQRELREILNFSETKMSLIMAELETTGHIKRIKRGRENIVKLKNAGR